MELVEENMIIVMVMMMMMMRIGENRLLRGKSISRAFSSGSSPFISCHNC